MSIQDSIKSNPEYIEKCFDVNTSNWNYFWDVMTASTVYNIPLEGIVYYLSIHPKLTERAKRIIENFYTLFELHLNAPPENIVQLFFYHYDNSKEKFKQLRVFVPENYMILDKTPDSCEPFVNNQGWRLPNIIKPGDKCV